MEIYKYRGLTPSVTNQGKLTVYPYSLDNLHEVAAHLNLSQEEHFVDGQYPHYQIPKKWKAGYVANLKTISEKHLMNIISKHKLSQKVGEVGKNITQ